MKYKKIGVLAARGNLKAEQTKNFLLERTDNLIDITNNHLDIADLDLVILIGGDGLMLHLLHEYHLSNPNFQTPIYGINCGTVGFLMNSFSHDETLRKIEEADLTTLYPLRMDATTADGKTITKIAVNEVSLIRKSSQAAKIRIIVNDQVRLSTLVADGVIVSTAAGSTAYNLSVRGPIIPFGSNIFALTPISPFRPRSWNGALLPSNSVIKFEIISPKTRPVSSTADYNEIENVVEVIVSENRSFGFKILFDKNHSLEERIIREQFL